MPYPLPVIRRTSAEILASAILQLFPDTLLIGGELTEVGFAYDFVSPQPIKDQDIALIEETVRKIIATDEPIQCMEMMRGNAGEFFQHHGQPYLEKMLAKNGENIVSVLKIKEFFDLCPPPYLSSTKNAGVCKVLAITHEQRKIGDHKKAVLVTRIEGTAFPERKSLKKFLKMRQQAEKRDHQKLGPELDLFCQQEGTAPGCWSWLPKGKIVQDILIKWWTEEHREQGYHFISTPTIGNGQTMGGATLSIDNQTYSFLPHLHLIHAQLFKIKKRSYRELPLKYAEIAQTFLPVPSNRLCGMFRSRLVTADHTHSFCEEKQGEEEVISSLLFFGKIIRLFHVDYRWYLVSKTGKGERGNRNQKINLLVKALKACNIDYINDPIQVAEEGPRIELRLPDSLGREWPGPTIGISDCVKRMELRYQGNDDHMHHPLMISRSCFGSLERFFAILVEQCAGLFPLWLAPEQVQVIPLAERHRLYAKEVNIQLQQQGIRSRLEEGSEAVAAKVYAAEQEKIPYLLVVGDAEEKKRTVAIRARQGKRKVDKLEVFIKKLHEEMNEDNNKIWR